MASARAKRLRIVGQDAEIGHHDAQPFQQLGKQIAVGVVDRRAAARRTGLHHFVAGGKDRDVEPPAHLDLGDAERGGNRDMLRLEHRAGRQHHVTGGHVLPGETPIRA